LDVYFKEVTLGASAHMFLAPGSNVSLVAQLHRGGSAAPAALVPVDISVAAHVAVRLRRPVTVPVAAGASLLVRLPHPDAPDEAATLALPSLVVGMVDERLASPATTLLASTSLPLQPLLDTLASAREGTECVVAEWQGAIAAPSGTHVATAHTLLRLAPVPPAMLPYMLQQASRAAAGVPTSATFPASSPTATIAASAATAAASVACTLGGSRTHWAPPPAPTDDGEAGTYYTPPPLAFVNAPPAPLVLASQYRRLQVGVGGHPSSDDLRAKLAASLAAAASGTASPPIVAAVTGPAVIARAPPPVQMPPPPPPPPPSPPPAVARPPLPPPPRAEVPAPLGTEEAPAGPSVTLSRLQRIRLANEAEAARLARLAERLDPRPLAPSSAPSRPPLALAFSSVGGGGVGEGGEAWQPMPPPLASTLRPVSPPTALPSPPSSGVPTSTVRFAATASSSGDDMPAPTEVPPSTGAAGTPDVSGLVSWEASVSGITDASSRGGSSGAGEGLSPPAPLLDVLNVSTRLPGAAMSTLLEGDEEAAEASGSGGGSSSGHAINADGGGGGGGGNEYGDAEFELASTTSASLSAATRE